jgi:hypothetical protein
MQLLRRGCRADHGATVMFDKSKPKLAWDQTSKAVRISVPNIRDVDQKRVMHDYYLSLSIDDVQQIVGALADGAR